MDIQNPSRETIKDILQQSKTIAVVGLSDNPNRTSYQISKAMQDAGYKIIPVNPNVDEVLGEKSYRSLLDLDQSVDLINVFRRSEHLPALAKEAAQIDAPVFWAQQGVASEEAYRYLTEQNKTVIMDMCIKVAHSVTIGK